MCVGSGLFFDSLQPSVLLIGTTSHLLCLGNVLLALSHELGALGLGLEVSVSLLRRGVDELKGHLLLGGTVGLGCQRATHGDHTLGGSGDGSLWCGV